MPSRIAVDPRLVLLTLLVGIASGGCRPAAPSPRLGPSPERAPRLNIESLSESSLTVALGRPGHLVIVELGFDAAPRLLYATPPNDSSALTLGTHTLAFLPGVALDTQPSPYGRAPALNARRGRRAPAHECIVFNQNESQLDASGTQVSSERRVCGWFAESASAMRRAEPLRAGSRFLLLFATERFASLDAPHIDALARHVAGLPRGSDADVTARALALWLLDADSRSWGATVFKLR